MNKTYYEVLGVTKDADEVVIRAAYKALAQKYHPDKSSNHIKNAESMMSQINQAYDTLSNSYKRSEYDKSLNQSRGQTSTINKNNVYSTSSEKYNTQRHTENLKNNDSLDAEFFKSLFLRIILVFGGTFLAVLLYRLFE